MTSTHQVNDQTRVQFLPCQCHDFVDQFPDVQRGPLPSSRSRGSPPGSEITSIVLPSCDASARGWAAHRGSSSALNEYSCSIRVRLAKGGCSNTGVIARIEGGLASVWGRRWPLETMNSSSWRSVSNVYPKYTDSPSQPGCDSVADAFNTKLGSSSRNVIFCFDGIRRVSEVDSISESSPLFQP